MRWDVTRHAADLPRVRVLPGTQGFLVASSLGRSIRLRVRRPAAGILEASRRSWLSEEPWRASGARRVVHAQWRRPPAGVLRRMTP
jgi:hypothetical protein